jgi:hypothetical protein
MPHQTSVATLRLALLIVAATVTLSGQQTSGVFVPHEPLPYTPFVYDQDWSYLSDARNVQDFSDRLHFVPLNDDETEYIDFTGQIRERGEYFDHPAWGAQPPDNGYLLQRYLFSADLHLAPSFRVFCQLGSSLIDGRDGGPRVAVDKQELSFNQCFADVPLLRTGKKQLTIRAGRQLVSLGSTRLVAIGAGLNVEQPFDGARLMLDMGNWQFQGLALRPVAVASGILQSGPDHTQELWGVYGTHSVPIPKSKLDLYYLGYDHAKAIWNAGFGREQRQSFGIRLYAPTPTWYYDWEFIYQTGRFGPDNIRAWSIGTNTGYRFRHAKFTPRVEIDTGAMSGDGNLKDKTLGTFNSLFPNGSYLGQALLLGPYNVVIARPKLELHLTSKLTLSPNFEALWRESTTDGIYGSVGYPTHAGTLSGARFVGSQIDAELDYRLGRHMLLSVDYEHFFPGEFLKQTPPNREVNFIAPQITYNF